jgi:hypothetical protein
VNPAGCHGRFFWRVISAGYFGAFFGGFSWPVKQAGFWRKRKAKKKKEKAHSVVL